MREGRSSFILQVAIAAWLVGTLTGCDHLFGLDKREPDPAVMHDQSASCMKTIGTDFSNFLKGSDRDPVEMVDCLSLVLTKFANDTRGRTSSSGWTRSELATFFETYFKTDTSPSVLSRLFKLDVVSTDEVLRAKESRRFFVDEVFRWKSVLLGGADQALTRHELARVQQLLQIVRPAVAKLRGQGPALSFNDTTIADLRQLALAIRSIADTLVAELNRTDIKHSTMRLQTFALALDRTTTKFFLSPERRQLASAVKVFLIAGTPEQIDGNEWGEVVHQGAELLIAALRFKYGVSKDEDSTAERSELIGVFASDIIRVLSRAIARHGGTVDRAKIVDVINAAEKNDLLPMGIRAVSIVQTLEAVFGHFFGDKSSSDALCNSHLSKLSEYVADWREGQRLIDSNFPASGDRRSVAVVRDAIARAISLSGSLVEIRARRQMSELLSSGRPMVHDQNRLLILPRDNYGELKKRDLEIQNVIRVLVTIGFNGYASDPSRRGLFPKITDLEAQQIFEVLRPIGSDIAVVDTRSLTAGLRTFMEANLFLSVSESDGFVSFHEGVEWFHIVRSAGKIADAIHRDLVQECGVDGVDVFKNKKLKADCFRSRIWDEIRGHASNLQYVLAAANQATTHGGTGSVLTAALERASRTMGQTDLPVESAELRVMLPVLNYAESLMVHYDLNRSGILDEDEIWRLFPLVQPLIQSVAGEKLSDTFEKAIFTWLIIKGAPPERTFSGKVALGLWVLEQHLYRLQVGVTDILGILGSFQKVGRDTKNQDAIDRYIVERAEWDRGIRNGDPAIVARLRETFQCAKETDSRLAHVLQSRRAELFADAGSAVMLKNSAVEFISKVKNLLYLDPELMNFCQMF